MAHIYNSWQDMPSLNEQLAIAETRTTPDFFGARLLLKPGRKYEEAVKAFSPYNEVKDPYPEGREAGAALVRQVRKSQAPTRGYIYVNNRFEGNALETIAAIIEEVYINDNEEQARGPDLMDFQKARERGLIQKFNPLPVYFEHLRTLINTDVIAENPQRFVVDSMYGSGRGVIKGILQGTGCEVTEIRGEMNPGFGGVHPEPIGRSLGALAGAISTGAGDLGLATDGDADRIGAMDRRGNFVDPHKIMALALRYLVDQRGWRGPVVRTVSTTSMIDRLAERYQLALYETPVGFNYIADQPAGHQGRLSLHDRP